MNSTLAIILAGGRGTRLGPLTRETPKPVLPFAGTYRLIDFVVSNCLNSGVDDILVVTGHGSREVRQYVERLRDNLREGSLEAMAPPSGEAASGTAEAVAGVLPLLERIDPRTVLVLASDHVYRMDYGPLVDFHRSVAAGVTVGSVEVPLDDASQYGVLDVDSSGRIAFFVEKPARPGRAAGPERARVSMGIYAFDPGVLRAALAADGLDPRSSHDFGNDVIPGLVRDGRAWTYPFAGYWRDVGTPRSYMAAHRDLLCSPPLLALHDPSWPILSAAWPLLPRLTGLSRQGSLLCPGSLCEPGSTILRSVVSPAAHICRGAALEDCVVLDGAQVGSGARLRRVIVDIATAVPEGAALGWSSRDEAGVLVISGEAPG